MSYWTNVSGLIRVDSLRFGEPSKSDKEHIIKVLGEIYRFGDEYKDTILPCGSEGSLQYELLGGENEHAAVYVIPIWGDLRDYGEDMDKIQYIEDWFNNACSQLDIRQATITIEGGCLDAPKTIVFGKNNTL